ncbi:RNA polymerase sigma factor [Catenuloplanes indicus]|uniref:RNA polymerase sigma factor 70 region 4 type 2 domain-containing protein n=1 Tax=Catenuloplanes indicus TaxID=137267 RepID=A0AAE4B0V6_9ACTN|nr:sigma factor-like helix-turn-helix DNA-binding protein [Catenuloplanes indicus]MDQ0369031.1 hypothetical protein [Catenuloplanes indicus]
MRCATPPAARPPRTGAREAAASRVDAARDVARLSGVLARLPRRQRDVRMLFAVAELEYGEIAAALGIPLGSVRSSLHRARTKVRAGGGPAQRQSHAGTGTALRPLDGLAGGQPGVPVRPGPPDGATRPGGGRLSAGTWIAERTLDTYGLVEEPGQVP